MNLSSTISIFAGGPGSGCKGDNCGRPKIKWGKHSSREVPKVTDEFIHTLSDEELEKHHDVAGRKAFILTGGGKRPHPLGMQWDALREKLDNERQKRR